MKYFATFDPAGLPLAFFNEQVHGARLRPVYGEASDADKGVPAPVIGEEPNPDCKIPTESVSITEQQWRAFVDNPGRRRWLDGHVMPFEPPGPEVADLWAALRHERTRLLSASDWTQLPDAPVDQDAWAIYRQELRDLPDLTANPAAPNWPVAPSV